MCSTDMNLSLNGDTFAILKEQFDNVINRTVGNMQMKGADDATLTLKLSIALEKTSRNTPDGIRDVVIPKFKHDISSVMQVKDKVSGQLVGDYQLVFDEDEGQYVMRKINDGQMNIFDEPADGTVINADYTVVEELPDGKRALPEPSKDNGDLGEEDDLEGSGGECETAEESKEGSYDKRTPFGWLSQFVGEKMRCLESMGNYTVRTIANKVVLSSATTPDSPFYCEKEKLIPHVDHELICTGFGRDSLVVISIQCAGCNDALFTLVVPGATEEEISEAMRTDGDEGSEMVDEDSSYEYDEPEEAEE